MSRSPRCSMPSNSIGCSTTPCRCDMSAPSSSASTPSHPPGSPSVPAEAATFLRSGKVRDLYLVDGSRLLMVASDRLSAFDVVLPTPIPDKGRVLTGLTRYWLSRTRDLVPDHLLATDPGALPAGLVADLG